MNALKPCQGYTLNIQARRLKAMDASILVVSGEDFVRVLLEQIDWLQTCTLQVVAHPQQALKVIEAKPPDLLLCWGQQAESVHLCQVIKSQSQWSSIYCLLLGDRTELDGKAGTEADWTIATTALMEGADAYLWIEGGGDRNRLTRQIGLIEAQIQVGLRWVKHYRDLIQTNDILSTIALSDPLTEISNRRALEWELPRQIQNARNRSLPLSLLIFDVDYFKAVNDNHGHLVGDRVLKLLATRIRHNLRYYDTPFRYGGEEFVVLLNNTNPEEAFFIARRLCQLVSDQPFIIHENLELQITISAGIASLKPEDDSDGARLLNRADRCLLRAKSEGRNRVISSDIEPI